MYFIIYQGRMNSNFFFIQSLNLSVRSAFLDLYKKKKKKTVNIKPVIDIVNLLYDKSLLTFTLSTRFTNVSELFRVRCNYFGNTN